MLTNADYAKMPKMRPINWPTNPVVNVQKVGVKAQGINVQCTSLIPKSFLMSLMYLYWNPLEVSVLFSRGFYNNQIPQSKNNWTRTQNRSQTKCRRDGIQGNGDSESTKEKQTAPPSGYRFSVKHLSSLSGPSVFSQCFLNPCLSFALPCHFRAQQQREAQKHAKHQFARHISGRVPTYTFTRV